MHRHPLLFSAISFVTAGVLLVAMIQLDESPGLVVRSAHLCVAGAFYGFVHGFVFGRRCAVSLGWASFAAAAALSLPVVLVTYGFALAGAPLIAAYAVLVSASAILGGKLKEIVRAA